MDIHVKRVYEAPSPDDGKRVLVDRLWPRGLSREKAHVDLWLKELAPSTELRKWFNHEPEKWDEFRRRYLQELQQQPAVLAHAIESLGAGPVTLLFGSREARFNDAVALKAFFLTRFT
ncbi:MAG: hypothetical protein BGP20_10635 [Thiobacillus sp. 63-78]|uniref:DUF488 domain-containing protein n=1 Tax=Thiobacillus sp. 63-78 TaxID=1895859 RepID=UPI0009634079|nr:DUF488 family protein [Thiobacillus sp. 63-78]MBN8762511.1 DUF488 family protein [Thiobacillus sp.]MBN8774889.1 DUF488 family protein [Thiobacillus sp.]OJZ16527.1 MAG: hypothetical protein BGP20_10635 [Thiobacillus sp. 63-78]